ncbi:MAG: hypothetical protein ACPLRM_08320 [Anaerolineae bacterium]
MPAESSARVAIAERDASFRRMVEEQLNNGVRITCAIAAAARTLGMTDAAARTRWYFLMKKDNNVVPMTRGGRAPRHKEIQGEADDLSCVEQETRSKRLTPEMEAKAREIIRSETAKGRTKKEAMAAAARELGVSIWQVDRCMYRRKKEACEPVGETDLKQELLNAAAAAEKLSADEIQKIADKTGTHYHTTLSTLGALHRTGEVASYREVLAGLRELVQKKAQLEAQIAEAQRNLGDIVALIEEIRKLVAG